MGGFVRRLLGPPSLPQMPVLPPPVPTLPPLPPMPPAPPASPGPTPEDDPLAAQDAAARARRARGRTATIATSPRGVLLVPKSDGLRRKTLLGE